MVVVVLGWSQRRGLWGLQQAGKWRGGLVPRLLLRWLLLVGVLLGLLRVVGVVNLGGRLILHQGESGEERLWVAGSFTATPATQRQRTL